MNVAHTAQPTFFPHSGIRVDWNVHKELLRFYPSLTTVVVRGVNTKDRVSRHFGAVVSPECEHMCGVPDTVAHRASTCVATRALRTRVGITETMSREFGSLPIWTQECCLWELPGCAYQWSLGNEAHGFLLSSEATEKVLELLRAHPPNANAGWHVHFMYVKERYGSHPLLHGHAAFLCFPSVPGLEFVAFAPTQACSRRTWECQALLLLAVVQGAAQIELMVHGFSHTMQDLWKEFEEQCAPQSYLAHVVKQAMPRCHMAQELASPQQAERELLGELYARIAPFAAGLQENWSRAMKWGQVFANTFDSYPQAHALSGSHGKTASDAQKGAHTDHCCARFPNDGRDFDFGDGGGSDGRGGDDGGSSSLRAFDSHLNLPFACSCSGTLPS